MEKAILKTLIYADIFDYPLKMNDIHKWLIGRKANLRQVESAIGRLVENSKLKIQGGYYFLPGKNGLIIKRKRREGQSAKYFRKAKILCQILKIIPWIKLVGISGGLALCNASKKDDIDLFIITAKNRLWISRLLALVLLSLIGQRRKVGEKGKKIAGKLCLNILLEEDRLEQQNKDIFVAHEVLQMKVLWQRDGIYAKYLERNSWAFKFLPNWVGVGEARLGSGDFGRQPRSLAHQRKRPVANRLGYALRLSADRLRLAAFGGSLPLLLEILAKKLQLKIMQKPKGLERIEDGALYFHPEDCRSKILSEYQRNLLVVLQ